ncbi:hypothetical protein D910_10247 [Dendroctonus ponderosae]
MWLDEVDEIFKGYNISCYILIVLPIFILVSSTSPVSASHEFPAYRMQHFDLHGMAFGSRMASVNLEARSISTFSSSRHCVFARLMDLSIETYRNIRGKAGALIVELPKSLSNLTQDEKQHILMLEQKMIYEQETSIPVYFTKYNNVIDNIVTELSTNVDARNKKKSAAETLFSSIAANGYQIVISAGTPTARTDTKIATIYGHLAGYRPDGKVPTIAIVTHYDSFGVAPEASFVLCLDTLAASDTIFMHVSKPPKDGSPASIFYKNLKSVGEDYPSVSIEGVHKKINLAEDILAWEHERYSIRRLTAFTLSSVKSHKDSWRSTILDNSENLDINRLERNAKIIVNSIGKFVYDIPDGGIFGGSWDVNPAYIDAWLNHLAGQPRSSQLLSTKDNALVVSLQDNFNKYLRDVKITFAMPDKRDPDYQFFGTTGGTLNIYSVKPAVFDLIVTLAITLYLVLVYVVIHYVPVLYSVSMNLMKNQKVKAR